ncbi:D-3-phosphoglycerate dehydrogenase [Hyaloraphidium curvatum]|nr:D-3-phosphoglycerate dehydrogenase [Hyaloraphidium curvatum]
MASSPTRRTAKPRVLISDELSERAVEIFVERGIEVDVKVGLKPDELKAIIGLYDGLAIRSNTKVTKDVLEHATNLKIIGRAGIGVDNVDIPAASAKGIVVENTPLGNSVTTAEHSVAMLMALARQIPQANASTHAGKWEKSKFMGVELYAKTLGVVGCGNIGAIVANRCGQGLKMKVIAFDPYLSDERAVSLGVEKVELDELFRRSDFITLHVPATPETRGMINAENLAKMKQGVRIVNCARGELVVEADLLAALESGHVAGAAIDVFAVEPAKSNILFNNDKVVCTPHLGASSVEAQFNVAYQVAEQLSDFLIDGAITNALNFPSVSAEDAPRLRPYMKLCEQLGSFTSQIMDSKDGLQGVEVLFEGHVSLLNTRPLTSVALAGLLSGVLESVNMVNAPVILKERNIKVSETKREMATNYPTLVRVSATFSHEGASVTRSVAGTIFGEGKLLRIVEIDGISIEAEVSKHMMFVRNEDKPGFIGRFAGVLGDAGVNIATFALGRDKPGGSALAIVQVDGEVPDEVIQKSRQLPGVKQSRRLRF